MTALIISWAVGIMTEAIMVAIMAMVVAQAWQCGVLVSPHSWQVFFSLPLGQVSQRVFVSGAFSSVIVAGVPFVVPVGFCGGWGFGGTFV